MTSKESKFLFSNKQLALLKKKLLNQIEPIWKIE